MKTLAHDSKPANLRDSLHQHLHMYALAASAAGVSMLALAQPGEAEIIYTPANVTIGPHQHYNLDLNGDGITDFTIRNRSISTTSQSRGSIFVVEHPGNAVAGHIFAYGFPWAYALRSGARIKKQVRHFIEGRAIMAWTSVVSTWSRRGGGSWLLSYGSSRFLGLRFKIDGEVHYGWARLSIGYSPALNATLTGYAYETIPNKEIKAGQEEGKDESTEQPGPATLTQPAPAPGTLGALAKGAQAFCVWRRNGNQSVVCERK